MVKPPARKLSLLNMPPYGHVPLDIIETQRFVTSGEDNPQPAQEESFLVGERSTPTKVEGSSRFEVTAVPDEAEPRSPTKKKVAFRVSSEGSLGRSILSVESAEQQLQWATGPSERQ